MYISDNFLKCYPEQKVLRILLIDEVFSWIKLNCYNLDITRASEFIETNINLAFDWLVIVPVIRGNGVTLPPITEI